VRFSIDAAQKGTPFPHYWELCVGSCHAYTALRADWQAQMKRTHNELGFQYVRFHGLLCDGMSVCVEQKKPFTNESLGIVYNFINIDRIFDFLLSIGMKPFVELGFMPSVLANGTATCFHYRGNVCPPKDYAEWGRLIRALAEHLVGRYGLDELRQWYFEVWNEPNLPYFWAGTQAEYFALYAASARAIKAVDAGLRVGGPATSINAWIPDMLAYCEQNGLPLDFLSTHHYPTDDPLWRFGLDVSDLLADGGLEKMAAHTRGVLREMTEKARGEAGAMTLIYTEWNISAICGEAIHDESYAAAMLAKVLADNDGLVQGYSYWTLSDIFEENAQLPGVFHGGYGLLTADGIPKPGYRMLQLLHELGEERLPVISSGEGSTLELLAVRNGSGLRLIAYNYQVPGAPVKAETCGIAVHGLPGEARVRAARIDEAHANPKAAWVKMGMPPYPNHEQIEALEAASAPRWEPLACSRSAGTLTLTLTVPPQGVCALDMHWK